MLRSHILYRKKPMFTFWNCIYNYLTLLLNQIFFFIDKIKNTKLKNSSIMASLDVVSLYPSIDIKEVTRIITNFMNTNYTFTKYIKDMVKRGLSLIINHNTFVFNNQFYKEVKRAPVASPISGLLIQFKLRPFQRISMETIRVWWFRYFDDMYIIWNH